MANYPQEFKDRVVELHSPGHSFNDLAREVSLAVGASGALGTVTA